jgi:hypothetical protein
MLMNRGLILLLTTLLLTCSAFTQQNGFSDYSSIGFQFYAGTTIGNTYNRISDSRPFIGEVYYERQTCPTPTWNHSKRLPKWGIGLSATHSGSEYVGSVVSIFPYMKLPLLTAGPFQSNFRFGFGIGWAQKPYNKTTNPENQLLSQTINTHANISWENEFRLTSHNYVNLALSYYHWSNAKTSLPNLGMNIPSVSIGYRYAFDGEKRKPISVQDTFSSKIFYRVFLSGGIKQMQVPDSSHYFVTLLTGEVSKQISHSSILSVGTFITHDESVKTDTLVTHLGSVETSQVAVYGSYEYNFGRLLIPVQFGVFVYNSNTKLLESVGMRYKISRNLMAELLLKAHGHKADLMHFGVGYVFR